MIAVYKITNKLNGNFYIGSSVCVERRIKEHKRHNARGNDLLHLEIQKYGVENFDFEIIEEVEKDNLRIKEYEYIAKLQPYYNYVGKKRTQEEKEKISISTKKWWDNLDKEIQQKIIINNLTGPKVGHEVSEETRRKLREHNIGKKQSKETIEKRIKKLKGRKKDNSYRNKPVMCIETGEIFSSIKEAELKYGLSTLCGHLKGRYSSCKGKHYKYL